MKAKKAVAAPVDATSSDNDSNSAPTSETYEKEKIVSETVHPVTREISE